MSALQKRIVLFLTMALMVWMSSAFPQTQPQGQTTSTTSLTTCANGPNGGVNGASLGGLFADLKRTSDDDSNDGEYPWIVTIESFKEGSMLSYNCAGSLIHPKVALTAARCLKNLDKSNFIVKAGVWDLKEIYDQYFSEPQEILIHPDFKNTSFKNDFALIVLVRTFPITDYIKTVCLAPANFVPMLETECYSGGWGKDLIHKHSAVLKEVTLSRVPFRQCQRALRRNGKGSNFTLDESFICAVGEKIGDVCGGDGGAPLVCKAGPSKPHAYYQTGIAAWGEGCGNGIPGAFASVSHGRTWIDNEMKKLGFGTTTYTAR